MADIMILDIAVRAKSRSPMQTVSDAIINAKTGLTGILPNSALLPDFRGKGGRERKRQITLLSYEMWRTVGEHFNGSDFDWLWRRANILTSGIVYSQLTVGRKLRLGSTAILEVTGETVPCSRMDEQWPGLQEVLKTPFFGGVTCRVINGGNISCGDRMFMIPFDER